MTYQCIVQTPQILDKNAEPSKTIIPRRKTDHTIKRIKKSVKGNAI